MAINTKKKASIILKDSNGSLFQAMPETKAEYVSYGNTDAASELARQADYDVSEATTEIETHTETTTQHIQPNGTISASNDAYGEMTPVDLYGIYLYNTQNHNLFRIGNGGIVENINEESQGINLLEDFYDENDATLMESSTYYDSSTSTIHIPANQHYYYDFSLQNLNFVPNAIGISLGGCRFIEEGSDDAIENIISVAGDDYISTSIYTGVSNSPDEPMVQFSIPAVGNSVTFVFNAYTYYNFSEDTISGYEPLEHLDKSITFENVDGTNFRLDFYWNTSRDVQTEETTKLFKTTITREDNTETVARSAISGLLQNIDASYEETIEQVSNAPVSNRYRYMITIGDSEGTESTNL